ncbi:MAG: hypothetical protein COV72_05740 [Candidatus Omnitrophica bacterium CG11_big_fil_rev_8_21_14_0_20_42_13]|uniref:Uncharacterized protein n=1 Tax=Candidatus Ghiorseimicrobium undicola TaxID=1974746 RepID=A0A2H0LZP0_9BACT|nr:MAG: hypothetical protein COV72_05740 [Candidatus Omnitrophica bacterium CG11_big_fil_rev_8_21_14_0_20_42_13]
MDYKKIKHAQVVLEFVFAFIIILLLFIGGFSVWSELNNDFVADTTNYQAERIAAGQGDPVVLSKYAFKARITTAQSKTMKTVANILQCDCISDEDLKNQFVDLYMRQIELEETIDSYEEAIASIEKSIDTLWAAWKQVPWCPNCCECKIECGKKCVKNDFDGNCIQWTYTYNWVGCRGTKSNPCTLCCKSTGWWTSCNLYCSGDDVKKQCLDIRPNPSDEHTQQRLDIEAAIAQLQAELDANQAELDAMVSEKKDVDNQIKAFKALFSCCKGVI